MEIVEMITFVKKNIRGILLFAVIGALVGVALYFVLPKKYIAKGSLYVTRNLFLLDETANSSTEVFTYEGYYAQQNAGSHADTLIGLLQSPDVHSRVLKTSLDFEKLSLRKLKRKIKVKKSAPQLVELTVSSKNPILAQDLWLNLAEESIKLSRDLNINGDTNLVVTKVVDVPVVEEAYRSILLNMIVGFGLGSVSAVLYFSVKESVNSAK